MLKVISLFDGMSCGKVALDRAGIAVDKYYASEIDKYAIQVSGNNYPDIIRLGNGWTMEVIAHALKSLPNERKPQ